MSSLFYARLTQYPALSGGSCQHRIVCPIGPQGRSWGVFLGLRPGLKTAPPAPRRGRQNAPRLAREFRKGDRNARRWPLTRPKGSVILVGGGAAEWTKAAVLKTAAGEFTDNRGCRDRAWCRVSQVRYHSQQAPHQRTERRKSLLYRGANNEDLCQSFPGHDTRVPRGRRSRPRAGAIAARGRGRP